MAIRPNRNAGTTVHLGEGSLTNIIGFNPVNKDKAEALAKTGITTVELSDGTRLAARHYPHAEEAPRTLSDVNLNALAKLMGFKAVIPTDWRDASREEALELQSNGISVIMHADLILVPATQ